MEQLFESLNEDEDKLYQSYLSATSKAETDDLFPNASEPLETPEFTPEKSAYTLAELQDEVDKLERAAGYEQLIVKVGGVALRLAVYAAARGLTGNTPAPKA